MTDLTRSPRRSLALLVATAAAALPALTGSSAVAALRDLREVHLADIVQLTAGGENAEAYWSPDGERLIFQSTRPPYACDQIFTMSSRAPETPTLVSTGAGRTTCSYFAQPAGERVLYASTHAARAACPPPPDFSQGYVWRIDPAYDLWTAKPDGSDLTRLTESPGYDAEATVCPLDGRILFTSTRDGDLELYLMQPDGSDVRRLTDRPGYDGGAFFSPDCRQIVWRAAHPEGAALDEYRRLLESDLVRPSRLEIWVADGDGKNARQVTRLASASFGPSFYPDGQRIVFSTNYGDPKGREFDLWAIDVDGSHLERLTYTPGFDGFPLFSPDGRRLVFASNRNQGLPGETDIYVASWVEASVGAVPDRAEDRFARDVAWLAADEREGRAPGSAGIAAAADFLEARFRDLGLAPAGEGGGYRQGFDVVTAIEALPATGLALDGAAVAAESIAPLAFSANATAEGEILFAGWGISTADGAHDDYAGLDAHGKVVVVRRFAPKGGAFEKPEDERRYSDLRYKTWNAREHGAVAVLFADLPLPVPDGTVEDEVPLPKLALDEQGDSGLPVVAVRRELAARLLEGGHRATLAVALERKTTRAENVVARIDPGASELLPGAVLIGAHYDHLGRGGASSLAPGVDEVHNGADDNASGTAAILEAARRLSRRRGELRRPVLVVAFSGEERGLLGSTAYVRKPPDGIAPAIVAMINLDMVGRLRDQKVAVLGIDSGSAWRPLVEAACAPLGLACAGSGDGYGPSDQTAFYAAGIPVLHLFTGTHDDYHKPSDDAAKVNATGGALVAELTAEIALAAATRVEPLGYLASPGPPPARGDARSFGASLGTVPDYAGPGEGKTGVLLAAVRPGGAAEKAGLQRGDLLIGLAGKEIRDINDFMFILRQAKPGEQATAIVERGGKRVEIVVVFGEPRRM